MGMTRPASPAARIRDQCKSRPPPALPLVVPGPSRAPPALFGDPERPGLRPDPDDLVPPLLELPDPLIDRLDVAGHARHGGEAVPLVAERPDLVVNPLNGRQVLLVHARNLAQTPAIGQKSGANPAEARDAR